MILLHFSRCMLISHYSYIHIGCQIIFNTTTQLYMKPPKFSLLITCCRLSATAPIAQDSYFGLATKRRLADKSRSAVQSATAVIKYLYAIPLSMLQAAGI